MTGLLASGIGVALWSGCSPPTARRPPRQTEPETADTVPAPTDTGSAPTVATDSGSTEGPTTSVVEGAEVRCADPSAREALGPFERSTWPDAPSSRDWLWGGGVVVADLDGDGWLDVITATEPRANLRWGGPDRSFALDPAALETADTVLAVGGAAADYDADGDLDLYLLRYQAPNVLFRNDGGRVFTDVTASARVDGGRANSSTVAAWGDLEHDGDLDLWVGSYGTLDAEAPGDAQGPADGGYLYLNLGDGRFADGSHLLPAEARDGYALGGGWHDLDLDGWLELYVANDWGGSYPNALLWNRAGTLVRDDRGVGLDLAMSGMGLGVGDVTGDGLPELLATELFHNTYLRSPSRAGAPWVDATAAAGLTSDLDRNQEVGWGAELSDLDDDGDLDAMVVYGDLDNRDHPGSPDTSPVQPDGLHVNDGLGAFTERGREWGFADGGVSRGFVPADLDGDGWLDVVKRDLRGDTVVLHARCGEAAWLRVRLHDTGGNRHAVGARVHATVGAATQVGWVRAGGIGFASGGPPEVHFGLGSAPAVDLEVHWPLGQVTYHPGIATRRVVDVTRPDARAAP